MKRCPVLPALFLLAALRCGFAAEPLRVSVDFAREEGVLRPLHGINKGPLAPGGLIDLTRELREIAPPFIRLHDCHWPTPDVVDIHVVFPNSDADPERPESYDFRRTDEYIGAARATGAQIIYRLGESIEHTTDRRYAHPPRDFEKWAAICAGVVRHYNEGWAGGFHHGIRYWEIWNEPENRPSCWSGTDEQYIELYRVTARALKACWPELKIGGPAVGASGEVRDGKFVATQFVARFLEACAKESLPLDFFSWHRYTDDAHKVGAQAREIRALLDARGFTETESHLNEWNFLPGDTWKPATRGATARERRRFYETMAGPAGAAFIVGVLRELTDARVDAAAFFQGELGGFGLFDEHGVPQANYFAMLAFQRLLETPRRVHANGALAGYNEARDRAGVLIGNSNPNVDTIELSWSAPPWSGATEATVARVDATHFLEPEPILLVADQTSLRLPASAAILVTLRKGR